MDGMKESKSLSQTNVQKYIDELHQAFTKGASGNVDTMKSMAPWLKAGAPASLAATQYESMFPPQDQPPGGNALARFKQGY